MKLKADQPHVSPRENQMAIFGDTKQAIGNSKSGCKIN